MPANVSEISEKRITLRQRFQKIDYVNLIGLTGFHLVAVLAIFPYFFSWSGVCILLVMWGVSGWIGVCLGYHRLFTHRSFQTTPAVERTLAVCGSFAMQGGVPRWVGGHRIHHAHSDTELDIHTPKHEFSLGHILWIVVKDYHGRDPLDFAKDLMRDKFMVFMNKYHWLPQAILTVLLFVIGLWIGGLQLGLSWVIWGIAARTVMTYHFTWFVNSAAHTWGYRNFNTNDGSRNTWWVALVSFGEGWHNNHHAQQRSAAHGMRWFEFDPTYRLIQFLELVGLAKDVKRPDLSKMDAIKS